MYHGWCESSNADFLQTGCNTLKPRTFEDQSAILGPEMMNTWSGAIIYEWIEVSLPSFRQLRMRLANDSVYRKPTTTVSSPMAQRQTTLLLAPISRVATPWPEHLHLSALTLKI